MNHHHFPSHLPFSPYPSSVLSLSPSPPDLTSDRKMKKPLMERKRRERINNSLNQLKEFHLQVAQHQRSKLEKADILEMTVELVVNMQKQLAAGGGSTRSQEEVASIFRRGQEQGYNQASRVTFEYLNQNMPPETSPHAQQFQMGLLQHLRRYSPLGFQSPQNNQKFSPLSPESSGSESPDSENSPANRSQLPTIPMTPLSAYPSTFQSKSLRFSPAVDPPLTPSTIREVEEEEEEIEVTASPEHRSDGGERGEVWRPWN